ncbi:MAG: hypothetical protein PHS79_03890 [Patescibacteria group bacterium]|nr:hypothetical protein [Patescibacteria group bacterium]
MTKPNAAKTAATTTTAAKPDLHLVKKVCKCGGEINGDHPTCIQCHKNADAESRGVKPLPCMNDCGRKTTMYFCVFCHKEILERLGNTAEVVHMWQMKCPNDPRFNKRADRYVPAPRATAPAPKPITKPAAESAPVAAASIDDLDALLEAQLESAEEYVQPTYVSYTEELETALEAKLATIEDCDDVQPVDYGPVVKDIKGYLARFVVVGHDVPAEPAPARKLSPAEQRATEIRAEARKIHTEGRVAALFAAGAVVRTKKIKLDDLGEFEDPHLDVTYKNVRCDIFDPARDALIKNARKELERRVRAEKAFNAKRSCEASQRLTSDMLQNGKPQRKPESKKGKGGKKGGKAEQSGGKGRKSSK